MLFLHNSQCVELNNDNQTRLIISYSEARAGKDAAIRKEAWRNWSAVSKKENYPRKTLMTEATINT